MSKSENSPIDSNRKLRIAYLSYRGKPHCGGQGVYTRHLTKALADLGHSVVVLSGQPYPELDERVELVRLPSLDIFNDHFPMRKPRIWELKTKWDFLEVASFNTGNFSEPLSFSLRAWDYLKSKRDEFDLVHDNQCLGWGLALLQKKAGFPLLSTIHHPITVDRRLEIAHSRTLFESFSKRRWYAFTKMQTRVAKRMNRVMTVSESSKIDIAADHKVDPNRIHVVPVGVDPDLFAPVSGVERKPGMLVTTASADVAMKGLKYLLEATAKLKTERDVELVIIGKPSDGGASTDVIDELGLTDCVSWVHGVSDDRIVELYSEAQIAVVPSLYEGFSLPAIEAMSCGVPLVTTTGGALPEVAGPHDETCFQVPPGDSEALASMIGKVLDSPENRSRVGENGRQRVIENWSWHHTALRTVEQYQLLLAESQG